MFSLCKELWDRSSTSPQPVETETGWDWSFNWWKLMKTALNWLTSVWSSFLRFFNLWGPVSVLVLSNFDERPDWTRLPSTNWSGNRVHLSLAELLDNAVNKGSLRNGDKTLSPIMTNGNAHTKACLAKVRYCPKGIEAPPWKNKRLQVS